MKKDRHALGTAAARGESPKQARTGLLSLKRLGFRPSGPCWALLPPLPREGLVVAAADGWKTRSGVRLCTHFPKRPSFLVQRLSYQMRRRANNRVSAWTP